MYFMFLLIANLERATPVSLCTSVTAQSRPSIVAHILNTTHKSQPSDPRIDELQSRNPRIGKVFRFDSPVYKCYRLTSFTSSSRQQVLIHTLCCHQWLQWQCTIVYKPRGQRRQRESKHETSASSPPQPSPSTHETFRVHPNDHHTPLISAHLCWYTLK